MRKILSIILENESGSLSRVIGLFSQRGYNIETITVAPTKDSSLSKMIIQTKENEKSIEQVEKQLDKLINVLRITQIGNTSHIEREIMLIKVQVNKLNKSEIKHLTEIFRGYIVDIKEKKYILQISGKTKKLNAFLQAVQDVSEILEVTRSGIIGMNRG